jgi:hypothetical protein
MGENQGVQLKKKFQLSEIMVDLSISDEERIKCQNVADAFAELYEMENIVVLDVGRYGFVKLQYYSQTDGLENVVTFTDCKSMFEDLWQKWLDTKLYLMAKGTPVLEEGYEGVFNSLTDEQQRELDILVR